MRRSARAAVGLLLLCGVVVQALAADWTYSVRPGDDLWRLAAKYCGSTAYAGRLAQHNGLARPQDLQAGARLRIPVDWLVRQPAEVEVIAVTGTVTDGTGQALAVGDRLVMGKQLVTADGFAVVAFADGSTLQVGENSEVLFNILTAFGDTGMVDTHLRFYRGRGTARVIKQEANSKFRIWTPSGIAAVRGTDFRVGAESAAEDSAGESTRLETVTGAVDFVDGTKTVDVPAGFGVVASAAGVAKEALLTAPVLLGTAKSLWRPDESIRWQADPAAKEYRVVLYQPDGQRQRPIRSRSVSDTEFRLDDLQPGSYTFVVRAVAASGLEGFDSQRQFAVGAPAPVAASVVELLPSDSFTWQSAQDVDAQGYELQIASDTSFKTAATYSSALPSLPVANTVAADPGRYYWRVKRSDSAYSEPQEIAVHPLPVTKLRAELLPRQKQGSGNQGLVVSWASQAAATYALNVTRISRAGAGSGATSVYRVDDLQGERHEVPELTPGAYRVELTAVAGGLVSEVRTTEISVTKPTPWWLAALFAVPLLFAL